MSKKTYRPRPAAKKKPARAIDPFFAVIAKVYGVPATGISAIGTQPYLNKDGRLYLLNKLRKGKEAVKAIRAEFIKVSTTAIEPAIVKKTIVFKNGIEIEATGEASQENVEKQSVKQTLNMVAETRALNRAIWQAIAGDIMELVEKNLKSMEISDENRARIMEAGRVSYEEMERPAPKDSAKVATMYDATAKRVDEISGDEIKLRRALTRVESLPLEAEQKVLIKEKIERALQVLVPPAPAAKSKTPAKKKKTKK